MKKSKKKFRKGFPKPKIKSIKLYAEEAISKKTPQNNAIILENKGCKNITNKIIPIKVIKFIEIILISPN